MRIKLLLISSCIIMAILPGSPQVTLAQYGQKWLVDAGHFDCIPVEHFGLKGVRLWAPEESIRNLLGEPSSILQGAGEDDGGFYDITIYHYPGVTIEAIRQHVDRIIATSASVAMPSGIRLGDSRQDVHEKFGRLPRSLSPDMNEFHLVTCPVKGEWVQEDYLTLEFDREGILTVIRYETNRP